MTKISSRPDTEISFFNACEIIEKKAFTGISTLKQEFLSRSFFLPYSAINGILQYC